MRKSLTPQEARLWSMLKRLRSQGFHFRRQTPFRGYYLDFVCFTARLVVEVDGSQHDHPDQRKHDAVRDRVLTREGFRTLRIPNAEVNTNLEGVFETIMQALEGTSPP